MILLFFLLVGVSWKICLIVSFEFFGVHRVMESSFQGLYSQTVHVSVYSTQAVRIDLQVLLCKLFITSSVRAIQFLLETLVLTA